MKKILIFLVSLTLISCGEKFKPINFDKLNQTISQSSKVLTPKDIMKIFYPKEVGRSEGNQTITMNETELRNGNLEVELIHDNQLDDSVRGSKYVMELTKKDGKWIVISLKRNWRCWTGRGHSNWGIKFCS